MSSGAYDSALDAAETLLGSDAPDAAALHRIFGTLTRDRPAGLTAPQLRRLFALCDRVMGLADPLPASLTGWPLQRLRYQAEEALRGLVIDQGARNRAFVQSNITRATALGRALPEGAPKQPVPLPHLAIDRAEAAQLVAPWLSAIEAGMAEAPLAHLPLCWEVLSHPVPPFHDVFDAWLAGLDAGDGPGQGSHAALHRAMALVTLAEEGRQKLTRANCEAELLPQLQDPHPLVATAAGRYLGRICSDLAFFITRSEPFGPGEILDLLRALPRHRRLVAGGFLTGLSADISDPFTQLRMDIADYDVDGWVIDIFACADPEPYLPAAQSFWFWVHEAYCANPPFIDRLIDAGHLWEAMMCATEIGDAVEGMAPVLARLAASDDKDVAARARGWLEDYYA